MNRGGSGGRGLPGQPRRLDQAVHPVVDVASEQLDLVGERLDLVGQPVHLVETAFLNLKITTPSDLAMAEALLYSSAK